MDDKSGTAPLEILFITSDKFPPYRPAAKAIFAEELTKRGHKIDWLIQAENGVPINSRMPYGNGTAYIARSVEGGSRFRRVLKHICEIINDFRVFSLPLKKRYHLIQVKDKYLAGLTALVVARVLKVPYVYWLAYPHAEAALLGARTGAARYRIQSLLKGWIYWFVLYRIIMPRAEHIFVQSEQMKIDLAGYGLQKDRMTAVPSSLNLDDFHGVLPVPPKRKPEGELWICYLGTLIRLRRLDFLVRVLERVLHRFPNAMLLMVGKGEESKDEEIIMNEAGRLGVSDRVVITGLLPMREAWAMVAESDVCVSPYFPTAVLNSTSPTKLIEYMALGRAVVGNVHPEQAAVIGQSGAGICCEWDEGAFTKAIEDLIDSPDLREQMGLAGREYVVKYRSNKAMADLIESVYFFVVTGSKRDGSEIGTSTTETET
jgi:glycosyltransferase involved in cell wall biosynthesis